MNDIDAFEFHEAFSVSHFKDTYQKDYNHLICVKQVELYVWSTDLTLLGRKSRGYTHSVEKHIFWSYLFEALQKYQVGSLENIHGENWFKDLLSTEI